MRRILLVALCAVMSISVSGAEQDRLVIYTVNYPLQYFAQRIAGSHAEVVLPVAADTDPAFWQPDMESIAAFQQADMILLNGAGYAKWLDRVSLPRRKLVDTSAVFRNRYIHAEAGVTHSHGPGGKHSHTGTAFTTWLDFKQAAQQAQTIADAMKRKQPQWQQDFEQNLAALQSDLLALDRQLEMFSAKKPNQLLLASHPVYQYLARRYNLNLAHVVWEPDVVPDEVSWIEFEQILANHTAKWMLWESKPNPQTVQRLQSMGVESIVFDPVGNQPDDGDFLSTMRQNISSLEQAFQ